MAEKPMTLSEVRRYREHYQPDGETARLFDTAEQWGAERQQLAAALIRISGTPVIHRTEPILCFHEDEPFQTALALARRIAEQIHG